MPNDIPFYSDECIAVIGMACQFPDAETPEQFWQNLSAGKESIRPLTSKELSALPAELQNNPDYIKVTSELRTVDGYDAHFFGKTPREAEVMDPQQRLFLELAHQALENAGYHSEVPETTIGVYASSAISTYLLHHLWGRSDIFAAAGDAAIAYGNDKDYLATSVSYHLDLKGPSINVNTACSSSLVAVAEACQSLLAHECDIALAGGVRLDLDQNKGYQYQAGGIFSASGRCQPFADTADGTVFGSGAGILVLKRMQEALDDGDEIVAVVRGFATNNDGCDKVGFTAPSLNGQSQVISEALSFAEIEPESIGYVESHGTATKMGDPIEIAALTQAYNSDATGYCAIGSVKANVGHLVVAAGIAGMIKSCLMVSKGKIPPSPYFDKANPEIDFADSPFFVSKEGMDWPLKGIRRAAISSFGIGGTNAHVIIEQPPEKTVAVGTGPQLITLSGKTPTALEKQKLQLQHYLQSADLDWGNLGYSLQLGRKSYDYRYSAVSHNVADAISKLGTNEYQNITSSPSILFMFTGQMSQYWGMAKELYEHYTVFQDSFDEADDLLLKTEGWSLKPVLWYSEQEDKLQMTCYSQVALFIVQHALSNLLQSFGIRPDALIGHSLGEYCAAYQAGVFSLEDAISLIALRGKLMQKTKPGKMLSVSASSEQIQPLLGKDCVTAAVNAPERIVVSGPEIQISKLVGQLTDSEIECHLLPGSHAFHSPLMQEVLQPFREHLEKIQFSVPNIPIVSNLTGTWLTAQEAQSVDYWIQHIREPVKFSSGVTQLVERFDNSLCVEVGPGNSLTQLVRRHKFTNTQLVHCLPHPKMKEQEFAHFWNSLGKLWQYGGNLNWWAVHEDTKAKRTPLPTYPFEHKSFWVPEPSDIAQVAKQRLPESQWLSVPTWQMVVDSFNPSVTSNENEILLWSDIFGESLPDYQNEGMDSYCITDVIRANTKVQLAFFSELINKHDSDTHAVALTFFLPGNSELEPDNRLSSDLFGLYQIFNSLEQTLSGMGITTIKVNVISRDMYSLSHSKRSVLHSYLKPLLSVLAQKQDGFSYHLINFDESVYQNSSFQELMQLSSRLPEKNGCFHYSSGRWWTPEHQLTPMENTRRKLRASEEGAYIIFGGLGGIGLAMADWLSRHSNVNLILCSRRGFYQQEQWADLQPETLSESEKSTLRHLEEIARNSNSVMTLSCDLGDAGQVKDVIASATNQYGKVNGIIHAAGVASLIGQSDATKQDLDALGQAKVEGLQNLRHALQENHCEFILLCSSVATEVTRIGQAEYAISNQIMADQAWRLEEKSQRVICIHWDTWNEVGMAKNNKMPTAFRDLQEHQLRLGISNKEALRVLENVMETVVSGEVLVSTRHIAQRRSELSEIQNRLSRNKQLKNIAPKTCESADFEPPKTEMEMFVAAVWQEFMGLKEVSRTDNFFELGGDSVIGARVLARVNSEHSLTVPMSTVFESPTLSELSAKIVAELPQKVQLAFPERPEKLTLSSAQQRIWLLQMVSHPCAYNMPMKVAFSGSLDWKIMQECVNYLIAMHEILRTNIQVENGIPYQQISPHQDYEFEKHDLAGLNGSSKNTALKSLEREFVVKPFDLSKDRLYRFLLVTLAEDKWLLLGNFHHIIFDAWSSGIFQRQLLTIYQKALDGNEPSFAAIQPLQYADFAGWQSQKVEAEWRSKQLPYWLEQLKSAPEQLAWRHKIAREPESNDIGKNLRFSISNEIHEQVKSFASGQQVTPYVVFLSAYFILLYRYTKQRDLCVGTPVSNRHYDRAQEDALGLYVNTLVLRSQLDDSSTFLQVVERLKNVSQEAFKHQDTPYDEVLTSLNLDRTGDSSPLIQVMFVLQNLPKVSTENQPFSYDIQTMDAETSKFDVTMFLQPETNGLSGQLEYKLSRFTHLQASAFVGHYLQIVEQLLSAPATSIVASSMLAEQEHRAHMCSLSGPQVKLPEKARVMSAIASNLFAANDNIAIRFDGQSISYGQLSNAIVAIKKKLLERDIKVGQRLGVWCERGPEAIAAMLACFSVGAIYVPFEPGYPKSRLSYMLQDAAPVLLLRNTEKQSALLNEYEQLDITSLFSESAVSAQALFDGRGSCEGDEIAYMIYTSGTTGNPKGVENYHHSLFNRLNWMQKHYDVTPQDNILWKTPMGFDVSVWEMVLPFMTGATAVISKPEGHLEPKYLAELLETEKVTILHFVPSMLSTYLQVAGNTALPFVRQVICSGEALQGKLVRRFFEAHPKVALDNLYGPTEAAIDVTWYSCSANELGASIPIGKAIDNTQIYLLDDSQNPVPQGLPGEIYIGGVNVASGYWDKPELTSERFIVNPFSSKTETLYRTGDLAVLNSEGLIEYLGRIDSQVKINGVRIELPEIESVLLDSGMLSDVCVLAQYSEQQEVSLLAFVVSKEGVEDEHSLTSQLRQLLENNLLKSVIPGRILVMEALPRTDNGKLDRKQLLNYAQQNEPGDATAQESIEETGQPRNELDSWMQSLWHGLLQRENIGIHQNFFSLGGSSLTAMKIVAAIEDEFALELTLPELLETPTIAQSSDMLLSKLMATMTQN